MTDHTALEFIQERIQTYTYNTHASSTKNQQPSSLHVYELRGLRPDELSQWAEMCATVFAYKSHPPPADYFLRHYQNDPARHCTQWIRVAVIVRDDKDNHHGKIVASVRVLDRRMRLSSSSSSAAAAATESTMAAGIGEVCTLPSHQRRGLSRALLKDALDLCDTFATVSVLHAAPAFVAFYAQQGYQTVPTSWTRLKRRQCSNQSVLDADVEVRTFDNMTDMIMKRSPRQWGRMERSNEYWDQYAPYETSKGWKAVVADDDQVLAYCTVKTRQAGLQRLHDFGGDAAQYLEILLLERWPSQTPDRDEQQADHDVLVPTLLWEQTAKQYFSVQDQVVDEGWMYRLDNKAKQQSVDPRDHLIWPLDSF